MATLHELLTEVHLRGGSDLHITVGVPPTMRLHGGLLALDHPSLTAEQTEELVFGAMTERQRIQFRERSECDFSYSVPQVARFRVNAYLQRGSVGAAFRLIPMRIRSVEELGLPAIVRELAKAPRGLIVVTGPTGSGKSTTLAAMIDLINETRHEHIVTIEDPIEYLHQHKRCLVNQREVGMDTESFTNALKFVLRQDPDVILIGEMRDLETISAALTAAETGHLVLATLHTQDAPKTVDRIIDVFPPHQQQQIRVQLSTTLQGIIAQQLIPTRDGKGRFVAVELLTSTPAVRNLVREGKTHQLYTVMQTGQNMGMQTMDMALVDLYSRGKINYEMAITKSGDPEAVRRLLGRAS